jgi:glucokinase
MQAIGVDVGGTNLRVARVAASGEILESFSERISRDPHAATARLLALVARFDSPAVAGVGVGIPGRVDARAGRVLSGGFLDLAEAALAERLAGATGKPVWLDGDCNMALLAECAVGAARGRRHVAMLTIGTGIGGAVMLDGEILRGRASAGQLGHLTVDNHGLPCACGRRGCVETTSSGTALGRLIEQAGLSAETRIDSLLDAGDPVAAQVALAWIAPLRAAIDSIVAAFDPELVLLGGGLGDAACRALPRAPAASPWYLAPVLPARLGDDAGVVGAALAALRAVA